MEASTRALVKIGATLACTSGAFRFCRVAAAEASGPTGCCITKRTGLLAQRAMKAATVKILVSSPLTSRIVAPT